jgi:predicted metalloendopeptidase
LILGCGDEPSKLGSYVERAMDRSADPCDDFYRYSCGSWLDAYAQLDTPRYGRGFGELSSANLGEIRSIVETTGDADVAAYFAACMDEGAIERAGLEPLAPLLARIDQVVDAATFMSAAGELAARFLDVPWDLYVDAPLHGGNAMLQIAQSGLGLPDRDYYFPADGDERALLDQYRLHVGRMLELAGSDTGTSAAAIVDFETELARTSTSVLALRSPENVDHPMSIEALNALAPLRWDLLFTALGVSDITEVNVHTPAHVEAVAALIQSTPPETLRAYLRFRTLSAYAADLPRAFRDERDSFRVRLFGPIPGQPRWRFCVSSTSWALPDPIGQEFVDRLFEPEIFAAASEILARVEDALSLGLGEAAWLDDGTRSLAIDKIANVSNKVGHPMPWPERTTPVPQPGYLENVLLFGEDKGRRSFARVGKPLDRALWPVTVPTVNAYYRPSYNEIVFPAGILQLPFFTSESMPLSFGGIGTVMGHELTHAIDDQGRKFAADGTLSNWWTPESIDALEVRAECLVDQFDGWEIQPGLTGDGELTLGENIADLGGVEYAHRAFVSWMDQEGEPEPISGLEDLTPEQLFFVAFAQSWCTKTSPETERLLAIIDVHAPPEFRVNGQLSNLPAFHQTFSCGPGSKMRRTSPCDVW